MDIKPILLPQGERLIRKAHELKRRGYSAAQIAAAMGLREAQVNDLLHTAIQKSAAEARPRA
jgi:DNA-directed RNA polymerase specialized sigma24 family protein